jgi:hypothetical protein
MAQDSGQKPAEEEEKYTTFQFRVTSELLSKFKLTAQSEHRSAANAIKMLMAEYVRKMSGREIDPGEDDTPPVKEGEKKS